jgi:Bax protein
MTTDSATGARLNRAGLAGLGLCVAGLFSLVAAGWTPPLPEYGAVAAGDLPPGYAVKANEARSARLLNTALDRMGYRLDAVTGQGAEVPRLFLASLPGDLGNLPVVEDRKALFLRTLLPLVLGVNESIAADRRRLIDLRDRVQAGHQPTMSEREWLKGLAEEYKLTTVSFSVLLRHVDEIPPSLALAQAAEESGWGTSRFAREGNSLFGHTVESGAGMAPSAEDANDYDIRSFRSLHGAVRAYARNLNTHRAYEQFRRERAAQRARGGQLDGMALAVALSGYSERGDGYVETIRSIIRRNELTAFDTARLSRRTIGVGVMAEADY